MGCLRKFFNLRLGLKKVLAIWVGSANFGTWMALFFLIYAIPKRSHELSNVGYGFAAAGIGVFATIFMGLCIISPYVRHLQPRPQAAAQQQGPAAPTPGGNFQHFKDQTLPFASLLFLGIVSVPCVLAYFGTALHKYYDAKWELKAGIERPMDAPGLAIFGNYDDDVVSAFIIPDQFSECWFPGYNKTNCSSFTSIGTLAKDPAFGNSTYFSFTGDGASTVSFSNATEELLLQVSIQWDSMSIWHQYNPNQVLYPLGTVFNPTLYSILHDPRLNFTQLQNAFSCGFLGWTEQPALGSTTYTIEEVTTTTDDFSLLGVSEDCLDLHRDLYGSEHGGLRTYTYRSSSAGADGSYCDRKNSTTNHNNCFSQILVRYGSFRTTELTSVSGIELNDIWVNIAGIMGAVAYVAAFSAILAVEG